MSHSTTQCDSARLVRFADGRLSAGELSDLEAHLEVCSACRIAIEQQSGDHQWWHDAAAYLSDDAADLETLSTVSNKALQTTPAIPERPETGAHVQAVLKWLAPSDHPERLGRVGTYEISGVIGSGGMGVVLKAFDQALNRYVAIKVLSPHMAAGGAARQRFAREAQAAAAIVHENVIAIHGVAEVNDLPYLVMPYVRGQSLQTRLTQGGPLSVAEILRVGMQAAAGLSAAHAQGLVHRDVKPANILLADGVERVTLTDFGLARAADDATITHTGFIAGTPQYMSPEQVEGISIDYRSDLFSLGSVLYAMCTGRPPFRATTSYGLLKRVAESEPRAIQEVNPDIPEWLCRIVERLLRKDREDRIQSAEEVRALLELCLVHIQQPGTNALPDWLTKQPQVPKTPAISQRLSAGIGLTIGGAAIALLAILAGLPTGVEPGEVARAGLALKPPTNNSAEQPTAASMTAELPGELMDSTWDNTTWSELQQIATDIEQLDQNSLEMFAPLQTAEQLNEVPASLTEGAK